MSAKDDDASAMTKKGRAAALAKRLAKEVRRSGIALKQRGIPTPFSDARLALKESSYQPRLQGKFEGKLDLWGRNLNGTVYVPPPRAPEPKPSPPANLMKKLDLALNPGPADAPVKHVPAPGPWFGRGVGQPGSLSRSAVAPLERLKILMQVQGNEKVYRSTWQGLVHMAKSEGVAGMFKGNGANCVRIVPNSAFKFFAYEYISTEISDYYREHTGSGRLTPFLRLVAGACAGIIAMSATYPLDMVRGRLTVQEGTTGQYRGIIHAGTTIIKEEGLVALYKGWLPSVIGVIPYVGLNFAVYESLKASLLQSYELRDERDLSVATRLACGAFAGTFGQTVAYPFDVARRRLQVSGWAGAQKLHASGTGQAVVYKGMVDCFSRTVREEGMRALFKGLAPNYVKVVPSIAIAFVTYEQVKEMLGVEFRISD
ncbi:hypothetical protein FOA52_005331 [Chlamydomonas sp. UWO 241]|nr:hypothetical protein FOA52_005331 [Chlamydomonas sp. UWO 241]